MEALIFKSLEGVVWVQLWINLWLPCAIGFFLVFQFLHRPSRGTRVSDQKSSYQKPLTWKDATRVSGASTLNTAEEFPEIPDAHECQLLHRIGGYTWKGDDGSIYQELEPQQVNREYRACKVTKLAERCWQDVETGNLFELLRPGCYGSGPQSYFSRRHIEVHPQDSSYAHPAETPHFRFESQHLMSLLNDGEGKRRQSSTDKPSDRCLPTYNEAMKSDTDIPSQSRSPQPAPRTNALTRRFNQYQLLYQHTVKTDEQNGKQESNIAAENEPTAGKTGVKLDPSDNKKKSNLEDPDRCENMDRHPEGLESSNHTLEISSMVSEEIPIASSSRDLLADVTASNIKPSADETSQSKPAYCLLLPSSGVSLKHSKSSPEMAKLVEVDASRYSRRTVSVSEGEYCTEVKVGEWLKGPPESQSRPCPLPDGESVRGDPQIESNQNDHIQGNSQSYQQIPSNQDLSGHLDTNDVSSESEDSDARLGIDQLMMADDTSESSIESEEEDRLLEEIESICGKAGIDHWEFLRDPGDHKKVFLFGHNMPSIQSQLDALASKLGGYRFQARNRAKVNGIPTSIFTKLCQDVDGSFRPSVKLPFTFKTWKRGEKEAVTNSTCGMIVCGEAKHRNGKPVERDYWAMITAHHVLSDDQCMELRCVDRQGEFDRIWDEICAPSKGLSFGLVTNEDQTIDVVGQPIFRYWHYHPKDSYEPLEAVDKFCNDILLFRLDYSQLKAQGLLEKDPDSQFSRLEVLTGPFSLAHVGHRYHHAKVKGIVPIKKPGDMRKFAGRKRIRVIVDGMLGYVQQVTRTRTATPSDYKAGIHFDLTLEDGHRLDDGKSGSIVYAIDKDDKQVYALAMLIGKFEDKELSVGSIYQAIALGPALKQLENCMGHRVSNISLIGSDDVKDKESDHVVNSMDIKDSGMFEHSASLTSQ